jgi:hypothetical protein
MVHEHYAPDEIMQEFLCVAMTYAVGSLAFKCHENLKLSGLFVLAQSVLLLYVHTVSSTF